MIISKVSEGDPRASAAPDSSEGDLRNRIVARSLHVDEEKMYRDDPRWVSACIITDKSSPLGFTPAYRYIFESSCKSAFYGFQDFFAAEIDYFCSKNYTGISSLYSSVLALRKELIKLYYTNSLRYYRALIYCSQPLSARTLNDSPQKIPDHDLPQWPGPFGDRVYGDKLCVIGFFTPADMLQNAQARTGIFTFDGCVFSLDNGALHSECKNSPALIVQISAGKDSGHAPAYDMSRILEPYCDLVPPIDGDMVVYEWRKHGMRGRDDDLPSVTFSDGTMIWYRDDIIYRATARSVIPPGGDLRSSGDQPALIGKHVSAWFDASGCIHRIGGPAVVCDSPAHSAQRGCMCDGGDPQMSLSGVPQIELPGDRQILLSGELVTSPKETRDAAIEAMYHYGMLHGTPGRDGTMGPAVTDAAGTKKWYRYDLMHADNSPAVIRPDGRQEYWCAGQHQCTV